MSYQQINLYQPIFRKQQKIFSARTMVQSLAVIALGVVVLFAYARWQSHTIAAQYAQLEQRRAETTKRMEQARAQFPERNKDVVLDEEVAALRKELEGRERIASRLDTTEAGNLTGFASYLEGLARQKPASLWLTEVELLRGGEELVLRGSALQPEQLPRYLQRLAQEPVFAGREFDEFQIAQPKERKGHYDFVVSTKALVEKGEKKP